MRAWNLELLWFQDYIGHGHYIELSEVLKCSGNRGFRQNPGRKTYLVHIYAHLLSCAWYLRSCAFIMPVWYSSVVSVSCGFGSFRILGAWYATFNLLG